MTRGDRSNRRRRLLLGATHERTRRAYLLAAGLFLGAALLRTQAPGSPLHECCHHLVFAATQGFTDLSGSGYLTENGVVGLALIGMSGLAAIHANLNEGYLPSVVLAGAPAYGFYLFNGPGAAPVWALDLVLPYAVGYGTLGFLIGLATRRVDASRFHLPEPPGDRR